MKEITTLLESLEPLGIKPWHLAALVIIIFLVLVLNSSTKQKKNPYNNTKKLAKSPESKASGIIFGKSGMRRVIYSPYNKEGHIAIFGGSGLGKTSALLITTLRSWTGTSFTIDISGDICKNVLMPNKLVYNPQKPESIPYNVFYAIDAMEDEDDKNQALEQLALILMPEDEKAKDAEKFFLTEGRRMLTGALIAFYHQGMDFIPICEKIMRSDWRTLLTDIDNTGYGKAIQYINSFAGANEQNTAGCKQKCDSEIKLFATNEKVKKTIRRPKTLPNGKKELFYAPYVLEKCNVFVIIDDADLKLMSQLLRLITAQSLEYFSRRSSSKTSNILFCLDEFASFGKLEITEALRKLRKKHIRIMVLTQSLADIDLIYGIAERKAMMNNFAYKVILGASDSDTQEYFAKLIGYKETIKHSYSKSSQNSSQTESEDKEWAIKPEELDHLGNTLIVLHPEGYCRIKKNFYYKSRYYNKLYSKYQKKKGKPRTA